FVQLATYREHKRIAFCVAGSGRGILASLRESKPTLRSDIDAIGDAVRAGVTRNKDVGQGNGLSGTLAIVQAARGQMNIISGQGSVSWYPEDTKTNPSKVPQAFQGT